jgi:30S ribosomal protein S31
MKRLLKTAKQIENMGRGDKKTKRGKISIGSWGRLRPKRTKFKIKPTTMANQSEKELK